MPANPHRDPTTAVLSQLVTAFDDDEQRAARIELVRRASRHPPMRSPRRHVRRSMRASAMEASRRFVCVCARDCECAPPQALHHAHV